MSNARSQARGPGRPSGTGKFREPTQTLRVPVSQVEPIVSYLDDYRAAKLERNEGNGQTFATAAVEPPRVSFPFVSSPRPQAGFPSPAADYVEEGLDLNELLIDNPPATFFARVRGESLVDRGIFDNDIVAVDRSKSPTKGKVVVAVYEGSIFIKVLGEVDGRQALCSENQASADEYPPMFLDQDPDHLIWGVVTSVVRQL